MSKHGDPDEPCSVLVRIADERSVVVDLKKAFGVQWQLDRAAVGMLCDEKRHAD